MVGDLLHKHWVRICIQFSLPVLINRMQSIIRRVIDGDTMLVVVVMVVCRSVLSCFCFIVMLVLVFLMMRIANMMREQELIVCFRNACIRLSTQRC